MPLNAHRVLPALLLTLAMAVACWPRSESSEHRPSTIASVGAEAPPWLGTAPEPPRASARFPWPTQTGQVTFVAAGSDLQRAIDTAAPGDTLVLEAGATFTGPFVLPAKTGEKWIVIQSSAMGELPPPGVRVGPADGSRMPVLEAAWDAVLTAEAGAHRYWFAGVEIRSRPGVFLYNLVVLGADHQAVDDLPHHIVFDRCYLHGDPSRGTRRGIAMNSAATSVRDSYLADFKEAGADSQAIAGWSGTGPFSLVNNYLEAAGENVMFGGADPLIPGLVPADIEIRRNHFFKPLRWKIDDREYLGTPWSVKNLLELKNARRVLIDGNVFEHSWPHAQNGFAILFTVRNQDGRAPWSTVEDVAFTNNIVRRVAAGINILGRDSVHPSGPTRRILIRNNLFEDVGGDWQNGRLFQLLDGAADVVIEGNTGFHTWSFVMADGAPTTGFVFRDNIVLHGPYGLVGSGTGVGLPSLQQYFPDAVMEHNAIVGGDPNRYPPHNIFPASLGQVGFSDRPGGLYGLADTSPLRQAGTDGGPIGLDEAALLAAQSGAARHTLDRYTLPRRPF